MDSHTQLNSKEGDLLPDPTQYHNLIDRLIYLTISQLDITFDINKLSQFMTHSRMTHSNATHKVLHYLRLTPQQGIFSLLSRIFDYKHSLTLIGELASTLVGQLLIFAFFLAILLSPRRQKK